MVEPLYQSPSFDQILPSLVFLQVCLCTPESGRSESGSLVNTAVTYPAFPHCRTFPLWSWVTSSGLVLENESWICAQHPEGRRVTWQH